MGNIICMKWGTKYGPEYVNRLASMVRRNTTIPCRFVCMTDDPAAERATGGYDAEVRAAGLPAEAAAAGGSSRLARLDPERLARQVLDACRRRRSELVVPRSAGLLAGLIEWFPDLGRRLLGRAATRRQDG